MNTKLKIAISTCLLGKCVRYNGGHKYNASIIDFFSDKVEWIGICPETESGLETPRPSMDLYRLAAGMRLISIEGKDLTENLQLWIKQKIKYLQSRPIDGFILKSKSPSCGLRVSFFNEDGMPSDKFTNGLWAKASSHHFPDVPMCEETDLQTREQMSKFLNCIQVNKDNYLKELPC